MRNARQSKREVDISKPFSVQTENDDCFGLEWDPQDKICAICAEIDICGIMTAKVRNPVRAIREHVVTPLDMADFASVPWDKLVEYVKKVENSSPVTKDELFQAIKDSSKIADDQTVVIYMERMLPLKRLAIDINGNIKFIG